MVLSGSGIGSIPQPVADHWWFTVPVGTGLGAHVAFYASVVVLLAGWVGRRRPRLPGAPVRAARPG